MGEAGRGHGDEGCGEGGSEKFLRGGLEGKGERGWRRVAAPPRGEVAGEAPRVKDAPGVGAWCLGTGLGAAEDEGTEPALGMDEPLPLGCCELPGEPRTEAERGGVWGRSRRAPSRRAAGVGPRGSLQGTGGRGGICRDPGVPGEPERCSLSSAYRGWWQHPKSPPAGVQLSPSPCRV